MFGKRAVELINETANCTPENLPAYNEELVRLVIEEVNEHYNQMSDLVRSMNRSGQDSAEWGMEHPEEASALVVHHACILRNKRLLMTYVKERAERIKSLRWSSRTAAMSIRPQLSATEVEFQQSYDRLLTRYCRKGTGVGMDLTLDTTPPSDPELSVRVRKDCGEVVLPSGTFFLKKNTCHIMPREEAEGLIRDGYVEALEHDNCLLRWDT